MTVNKESLKLLFTLFWLHPTLYELVAVATCVPWRTGLLYLVPAQLCILLHLPDFLCIIYILTFGDAKYFTDKAAEVWRAHGQWVGWWAWLWALNPTLSFSFKPLPTLASLQTQSKLPQFLLLLFNFLWYKRLQLTFLGRTTVLGKSLCGIQ